jgi:DNA polymerase-3 subunit delta'
LTALRDWLANPATPPNAAHLAVADAIGGSRDNAEGRFARDMLLGWVAEEAKTAAGAGDRRRLASATELWEKAVALIADTDEYNLDVRQTLVVILDAIKKHAQQQVVPAELR